MISLIHRVAQSLDFHGFLLWKPRYLDIGHMPYRLVDPMIFAGFLLFAWLADMFFSLWFCFSLFGMPSFSVLRGRLIYSSVCDPASQFWA
jgi:hypothetical protein